LTTHATMRPAILLGSYAAQLLRTHGPGLRHRHG